MTGATGAVFLAAGEGAAAGCPFAEARASNRIEGVISVFINLVFWVGSGSEFVKLQAGQLKLLVGGRGNSFKITPERDVVGFTLLFQLIENGLNSGSILFAACINRIEQLSSEYPHRDFLLLEKASFGAGNQFAAIARSPIIGRLHLRHQRSPKFSAQLFSIHRARGGKPPNADSHAENNGSGHGQLQHWFEPTALARGRRHFPGIKLAQRALHRGNLVSALGAFAQMRFEFSI